MKSAKEVSVGPSNKKVYCFTPLCSCGFADPREEKDWKYSEALDENELTWRTEKQAQEDMRYMEEKEQYAEAEERSL